VPQDKFHRRIDYLRISLTDHCNLRCLYCMPLRGLHFAGGNDLLTADEIAAVARAAVGVGFRKIRLTGGEPTLRPDLLDIVRRIAGIDGVADLAMTTNAILLPELAQPLVDAGLNRVNVHVDTLDPDRLKRLMRFGTFEQIWAGIESADRAGLTPIKINVVVARDYNDADVVDLARLTLERAWQVRFIELMPLGGGETARFSLAQFVPTEETRQRLEDALGLLTPVPAVTPAEEARNYRLPDAAGVVGFISPVSEPYCGTCNRMRLTADGRFHLCLLNDEEQDVRTALRNGGGIEAVQRILLKAVQHKPTGHRLDEGISTENRGMFQIGG